MTKSKTQTEVNTANPPQDAEHPPKKTAATPRKKGGIQPKTHAKKGRAVVKARRNKIIKAIIEGKTQEQAGIIAGLAPNTAGKQVSMILQNPSVQNALVQALEKNGISDEYLSVKLRALIEGTKVISATVIVPGSGSDLKDAGSMSKDFIEVPDNVALAKGIEIACKIKGQFTEKHEVDLKRPVSIIIRKFCTREQPPKGGAGA